MHSSLNQISVASYKLAWALLGPTGYGHAVTFIFIVFCDTEGRKIKFRNWAATTNMIYDRHCSAVALYIEVVLRSL